MIRGGGNGDFGGGGRGNDRILGQGGPDLLLELHGGLDMLRGGAGDDPCLDARDGEGGDLIRGGAGRDRFSATTATESSRPRSGVRCARAKPKAIRGTVRDSVYRLSPDASTGRVAWQSRRGRAVLKERIGPAEDGRMTETRDERRGAVARCRARSVHALFVADAGVGQSSCRSDRKSDA